ncbi:MAG: hypothetical protein IPL65_18550 [Lewinellaceae bacterium]|nr:hypothetical protein [Lewinellaceae bacterium]
MKANLYFLLLALVGFLLPSCQKPQAADDTLKQTLKVNRDSMVKYFGIDLAIAAQYADKNAAIAEAAGVDSLLFPAWINQAIPLFYTGAFDSAHVVINKVLDHPNILQYPKQYVNAMGHRANIYHYQLDFTASENVFKQILDYEKLTPELSTNLWLNYGAMLMTKKDFDASVRAFHTADSLIQLGYGDAEDRFGLFNNQGRAYFNLDNYKKAIPYFAQCIGMCRRLGNLQELPGIFNSLAHCYIKLDSLAPVPALLDSALVTNHDNAVEAIVTDMRRSDYFAAKKDYKAALAQALKAFEKIGQSDQKYYLVYNVTQILFSKNKLNDPSGTPEYLATVYQDCPTCLSSLDSLQYEGFMLLYDIWHSGDNKAYVAANDYNNHMDRYYRMQKDEAIHEQQVRYEVEKKEKENELLALTNQNKSQQISALGLGLLALLALAGALYYRNRVKATQIRLYALGKEQLERENQELLLAIEELQKQEISTDQVLQKHITLSSGKVLPLQEVLFLESAGDAVYFQTSSERHYDAKLLKQWEENWSKRVVFCAFTSSTSLT